LAVPDDDAGGCARDHWPELALPKGDSLKHLVL
jgi:hypothetical protein